MSPLSALAVTEVCAIGLSFSDQFRYPCSVVMIVVNSIDTGSTTHSTIASVRLATTAEVVRRNSALKYSPELPLRRRVPLPRAHGCARAEAAGPSTFRR